MRTLLLILILLLAPLCALAQDPAKTDPDKYHVILENESVRVLRYHDVPGDKTTLHYHPNFVLYALGPFRRRLTFGDGSTREVALKDGDVIWMKAQQHIGENIGTTDTDVIIVEMMERAGAMLKMDRGIYALGDTAMVTVANRGDRAVLFSLRCDAILEGRAGSDWESVFVPDCTGVRVAATRLEGGGDVVLPYLVVLPESVSPGQYAAFRLRVRTQDADSGEDRFAYSPEFTLTSSK